MGLIKFEDQTTTIEDANLEEMMFAVYKLIEMVGSKDGLGCGDMKVVKMIEETLKDRSD